MANQQDLKRKRRASERRRRRRIEAANVHVDSPSSTAADQRVDVVHEVTNVILAYTHSSSSQVRDKTVIAALRACMKGTSPGPDASKLVERLQSIPNEPGVDTRSYRAAVSQLLELASEHRDPRNTRAFIGYLGVLAAE